MMFGKLVKQQPLLPAQKMGLRVRQAREINYQFENERRKWHQDMKVSRKEHLKAFWETQTQAENMWLQEYQDQMHKKNFANLYAENTKIARVAWHTKRKHKELERIKSEKLEKMRMHDIKSLSKQTSKKLMLDAMELYSQREWPTLATIDMRIDTSKIIPSTILRNEEYHHKLQALAMFADQGDLKGMQAVLDNKRIMEKKNTLLQPIFRDLKSQIRFMSYTPEFKLIQEYLQNRESLRSAIVHLSPAQQEKALGELQTSYADLLRIHNRNIQLKPGKRLEYLQKRLEDMIELLNIWQQYVDVIYMPESETRYLHKMVEDDQVDSMVNSSALDRLQQRDTNEKLANLFGKKEEEDAVNAAYRTVDEGQTSDTTEQEAELSEGKEEPLAAEKDEAVIEEGILSSDDGESVPEVTSASNVAQTLQAEAPIQHKAVRKDAPNVHFSAKSANLTQQQKDKIEHDFQFSDLDLAKYVQDQQKKKETVSISADLESDLDSIRQESMESLNLFGLPDDLMASQRFGRDAVSKHNQDIADAVKQMVIKALDEDQAGSFRDFGQRKAYTAYDPYNWQAQYASLRYEDEQKHRASVVVKMQTEALSEIKKMSENGQLTAQDRDRYEQVNYLLERLSNVKIIDAPILLKLYNLYRYELVSHK